MSLWNKAPTPREDGGHHVVASNTPIVPEPTITPASEASPASLDSSKPAEDLQSLGNATPTEVGKQMMHKAGTIPKNASDWLPASFTTGLEDKLLLIPEKRKMTAEKMWRDLLREGRNLGGHVVAMEVGMYRANQCLSAAREGFEVHCVEPSPDNFVHIEYTVSHQEKAIRNRVHLYNAAAGDVSGTNVFFYAGGGTGDAVQPFAGEDTGYDTDAAIKNKTRLVKVPSLRLDDIVAKTTDGVFAIKVDTQGFEPNVFAGLSESLKNHKVDFILTEFWPRGMKDLYKENDEEECRRATNMMATIVGAGYKLYAAHNVIGHPMAPPDFR